MNIDTTALDALFDANPDSAKGIAAAYQVLLGGVPTQAGFTFLINNAVMTNFGAGPGQVFNAENIYINLANNLVLGNPEAATNFASISAGAILAEKIASLYNTLIPAEDRTVEGLAYLTRPEGLAFYQAVAVERGMAGDEGAAIVAMASLLQIVVRMDIGVGADVNDLIAAVDDGSSQLPADGMNFTELDVADGTNFDSMETPGPNPTPDNAPPTSTPVALAAIAEDSGPRLITQAELLANVVDPDGPAPTAANLVLKAGNGNILDNGNGTWFYTPTPNDDTGVEFFFELFSGGNSAGLAIATLDITPVNDAPTATPVTLTAIVEDGDPRVITQAELLANVVDPDGPPPMVRNLVIKVGNGILQDNGNGTWTYAPAADDDTSVEFSFEVFGGVDSAMLQAIATLDLTPQPEIFTANKIGFNTGNEADSIEGAKIDSTDATIFSTDAFLMGATVNGAGGNDTLLVTTTATVGGFGAVAGGTITEVDIINLQAGGLVDLATVDGDLDTINTSAASTIATDANNSGIAVNGGAGVDTLIIGGTDFNGTFTGGGGTDVISSAGGDINNAAIDVETLSLIGSADVLLTAAQHTAFSNINAADGNDTLRFFDAFTGTGDADVANYNLAGALNSNFTLGAAGQNVLESGGTNTINLGSLTATGNLTGFDGDDTAVVTTGGDITGVNSGNAIGARILNLSGLATMTEHQHNGFDIINATTQNDQINIAGGNLGIIITHADVETYSLGDDIGNQVFVGIRGAAQTVTTASADDLVGFGFFGTLTTFTGSLTGGGTAGDSLDMNPGTDISGGTLNSIENLGTIGSGTCTFTNAQISGFTNILAIGVNTAVITDAATITIDDAGALQRDDFENYTLNSAATDSITVNMANGDGTINTIDLAGGGADDVGILNAESEANEANDFVIYKNFTVGDDDIAIDVGGNSLNTFTTVGAGPNTDLAAGAVDQAVIEIAGANTISAATSADTSDNGNVELAILSAIGNADVTADTDSSAFILYGDGNAYIYTVDWTADPAGAALTNAQFDVELVAQVENVVLGGFAGADFI